MSDRRHPTPTNPPLAAGLLAAALAALALLCAPAGAGAASFGLSDVSVSSLAPGGGTASQAGTHPFSLTTELSVNTEEVGGKVVPVQEAKDVEISFPPGFVGSPTAAYQCPAALFLAGKHGECPDAAALGIAEVEFGEPGKTVVVPVYNLKPSPGVAAKIGFIVEDRAPVTVDLTIDPAPPHEVIARATNISQALFFLRSKITVWGVPADPAHDSERGNCALELGSCHSGLAEVPFITLPTDCSAPLSFGLRADSWQSPDPPQWFATTASVGGNSTPLYPSGCSRAGFSPAVSARPTSRAAESATGLDFSLDVRDENLTSPSYEAVAHSPLRKAVVALPEGMTANPSSANGLGTCTEAQLAQMSAASPPGAGCPDASKLGTIEIETPLLEGKLLKGGLYLAKPYENPEGTLLALYMVIQDAELGVLFEIPLKVEPDPRTGQLITTGEDLPQWPFSHFRLHFREGARSPLVTPPDCGSHQVRAKLYPWSGGSPIEATSSFEIITGPGGGACPSGAQPFNPGFEAGTLNNAAGHYSPFDMRLTRQDGDQDLTRFSAKLPPGVIGRLAGTAQCPAAAIAQARSRTGIHGGQEEKDSPSCPADSQIGTVQAGAGVGSILTYVPGNLYLAGPYNGAPLSVVAIVPALAGPFDAGTVVTQEALRIDTRTAEVEADGSSSDPIPHILEGIPLKVRDIRVNVDKPDFTLNPTSCEESATKATLWSGGSNVFSAADDTAHSLQARFQAAACASLAFKPRLGLKLRGGTRRGAFPALHLVYRPRKGDANMSRLALRFPHSEFIEQGHFRTICTRVQFAAGDGFGSACPKGSVYGHVKIWTPLLDEPLRGPVYLRSSNHNLPDVVLALHGPPSVAGVRVEVPTRIDSVKGGLRAIASGAPDVPVSAAVVNMQGGQKGLFVNSTNLCAGKHRARVAYRAQNGRRLVARPVLRAAKCKKARHKRHRRHERGGAR